MTEIGIEVCMRKYRSLICIGIEELPSIRNDEEKKNSLPLFIFCCSRGGGESLERFFRPTMMLRFL